MKRRWPIVLIAVLGSAGVLWYTSQSQRPCTTCLLLPDLSEVAQKLPPTPAPPQEPPIPPAPLPTPPLPAVPPPPQTTTPPPPSPTSSLMASLPTIKDQVLDWISPMLPAAPTPLILPYAAPPSPEDWRQLSAPQRLADARARLLPRLHDELATKKARLGNPAFLRVFKEERILELWLQQEGDWTHFRSYPIAAYSGDLGPKQREGDGQAPEGIYDVVRQRLNPASSYHLSFNIGYPNALDLHHHRTGSHIMVHGSNVSIGCYAMTDPVIEEIYLIVAAAIEAGQSKVPVHAFPFRMTTEKMVSIQGQPWEAFWRDLVPVYNAFEQSRRLPNVQVRDGRYLLASSPPQ